MIKLLLLMRHISRRRDGELEEMSSFVKSLLKDRCDEWGNQVSQEKDNQVTDQLTLRNCLFYLMF
jgi:hypothetical protein